MTRAFLTILLFLSFATGAETQEQPLIKSPEWMLYDASNKLVKSSDFAGRPLVIHFWATWCPYCKKLQPGLDALYRQYRDNGLQMIAISFWEDEGAQPQAMLDERGHSFKTLVDGDHVARELFGVKGTPTTVFIDAQGNIVAKTRISDPDDPRLAQAVEALLQTPAK